MKKIALTSLSLLLIGAFTTIDAESKNTTSPHSIKRNICQRQDCPYDKPTQDGYLLPEKREQKQELKRNGQGPHHKQQLKKHQHRHRAAH